MAARGSRGNLSRHSPAINKQSVDPAVPFMRIGMNQPASNDSPRPSSVGMNQPASNDSPRPSSVGSTHSNQSGSSLSNKAWSKGRNDICVGEELKIAVDIAMERFRLSEEQKELEFPSSFTSTERAYVHRLCQMFGLKSKSKGAKIKMDKTVFDQSCTWDKARKWKKLLAQGNKGANRYLTISKKDGVHTMHSSAIFHLVRNSRHQIVTLLQRFPITNKERQDLQPRTDRGQYSDGMGRELNRTTTGRLNNGVPQVPPPRGASDLSVFRLSLPVSQMKDDIVKAINDNRVVLVSGETGSGKTTQVPQMILDDCELQGRPCRLFCTQPRRLAALSVAERVAAERGEKIGQTVGYQIRLESRVSPKTLLTFCTNGVLLRTLMGSDNALAMVTHIIVDEVHERDRFNDFLLIALRDILPKYKSLKLILMSAALNVQLFSSYFNNCPIISVPGKLFDVQELFLEDVLKHTGYTNKEMEKYKRELGRVALQQKQLDDWCKRDVSSPAVELASDAGNDCEYDHGSGMMADHRSVELGQEKEELEPWLVKEMNQLVSDVWLTGNEDIFSQIFHLITSENISVDYTHSETGASPLMVAAGRGFFTIVEQLVGLGADVNLQASNDWTALDWAKNFERNDVIELLEAYISVSESVKHDESQLMKQAQTLSTEDRDLLSAYHHSFDDEKVDIKLVLTLIYKIHSGSQEGAILVFLPGYDEIVGVRDSILEDKQFSDSNRYILYTLHSSMQSVDQKKIFRTPPHGVRKIILSTNIAETSITINDVVFVIDSGKVKEKSFDALTSVSMLKCHWISKASALQRKGRAGRCRAGVCYHLFSHVRFDSMQEYQQPEILRYPLQELCLHTKLLAPPNCSVGDFLAHAPEPPAFLIIRNAIHILKQIDALDPFEDLTELGHHLTDLPVEPRYGKMVLYSVVLKCLDPVLTIACALAYKDPFLLPSKPYQKRAALMARRKFAVGTCSDHMTLLRAFQMWQKAKTEGWERAFCEKNFIAAPTMEMIVGMRTQLLGQLRASGFVRARGGGDIRDLNTHSENWAVVKAALCAGMYPNVMRVDRERMLLATAKENKVRFHTQSTLGPAPNIVGGNTNAEAISKLPSDWLVYEEMTRAHRLAQVKCCTLMSPVTISIFAGPAKLSYELVKEAEGGVRGQGSSMFLETSSDSEGEEKDDCKKANLRIDDWIAFKVDAEAASLVMQLRQKWHSLFLRRMRAPSKPWSQVDENVIRTVITVLTNEEQALGLQQPAGIGQRPRPMSTESLVCSGGNKRGQFDTDLPDDASYGGATYDSCRQTPTRGRPFKLQITSPRKRMPRGFDDHSETSSVRSSGSTAGSANNSSPSSLRGSATSSPCNSPQPASPGTTKWQEKDISASSPHACRYFMMKSNTHKLLDTSYQKGVWGTNGGNEKKLTRAFKSGKTVYLIFTIQGSGYFQGYAKLISFGPVDKVKDFPVNGSLFNVEWLKRVNLPFQQAQHLGNPWNENKKLQICRDGQEIEPNIGEAFLKLWDRRTSPQQRYNPRYDSQGQQASGGYSRGGYQGQSSQGQVDHVTKGVEQMGWNPGNAGYGNGKRHWMSSSDLVTQDARHGPGHSSPGEYAPQNQGKQQVSPPYSPEFVTGPDDVASQNPSVYTSAPTHQSPGGVPVMILQRGAGDSTQQEAPPSTL